METIIQSLVDCTFYNVSTYRDKYNVELARFITRTIMDISWFFKVPFIIYIHSIAVLAFLLKFKPLKKFSSKQKVVFYNNVVLKLPFSSSLDKLVRSLGFMKLYDLSLDNK